MQRPHSILDGAQPDGVINMLQDSSEEMVSIVIVHRDRPEYLNICLQSIAVTSLNNNYEIIVVDNGSTLKDAVDFLDDLESQGECRVIRNKENVWWSKAANQGARAADKRSKYFIFMHSDVVITNPAWMDLLINVSESQDSGMVGVSMHSYHMDKQKIDFIEEHCLLMTRECFYDAGQFPEDLPMIGAPFIMTMAAQYADHRPQVIRNPIIHHYAIFGMDVNDFEVMSEKALVDIPRLLRDLPTRIKRRKR